MKLIPLSRLPVSGKLLITCFLLTLSAGNVVAGIYTQKYVGISYDSLVETYSEREEGDPSQPHSHSDGTVHSHDPSGVNEFGEMEITLDQIQDMPHKVDLKLLLQDAHVHIFSHGVLGLLIGVILLWTQISERWKLVLVPLPFLGATLDFAGMFGIKFVAEEFAYLVLFAGALTGISFTIVFFLSIYEMWFQKANQ